jgi:hypothetical protein
MPPPIGVGERTLDADEVLAERVERLVRQPVARLIERLLTGEHFVPHDAALAAVRLGDRGIEHAHARRARCPGRCRRPR